MNRTSVGAATFARIAERYAYDADLALRAEVLSTQTHDGREDRLKAVVLVVTGAWPEEEATDHPQARYGHTLNFAPRLTAPTLMV